MKTNSAPPSLQDTVHQQLLSLKMSCIQQLSPGARMNVFAALVGLGGALLGYDIGSISGAVHESHVAC
jgi:hypothetical protein